MSSELRVGIPEMNPGNGWHVAATGDYNGDGIDDILWRNDDGTVTDWFGQSNGAFVTNPNLHSVVDQSWHVQPIENAF